MKLEPIQDTTVTAGTTLRELSAAFLASGGYTTKKAALASDILGRMFAEECVRILSFPSCIVATGTRGIVKELVKRKLFDYVFTTCGTLDHDIARSFRPYCHGTFEADDARLLKQGIYRIGNIFVPRANYGDIIEEKMQELLEDIYRSGKRALATYELVWELGARIASEESIIHWCAKHKIPVVIPGITDGAVGLQLLMFMQRHPDFKVDVFADEKMLTGPFFRKGRTGALMVGGGISKHHVIWWNQFKGGLDYAVFITTAEEYDGSLSGARLREAVSWGKVSPKAKHVTVEGDATVLLPLILGPHL